MSIRRSRYVVAALGILVLFSTVNAAELRGRLVGVNGTSLTVICAGQNAGSAPIARSGNYAVRGLPAGKNCSFTVTDGSGSRSAAVPFSTTRSLTIYSGSLRAYGSVILITRQ